jgi:type IV secretion system protein VirB10
VPPVDERIELALLSPMAATDVDLRNAGVAGRATASQADPRAAVERLISDQRDTRDKALGQQAELLERIASNGAPGGGGFPGVSNASGGMVPGARDSHKQFLAENRGDGGIGSADQLQPARTAATLYEGTLIRTVLTRPINSELPGMVTAVVSTDLYDSVSQRILLVPRGSEITCTYDSNLLVGQEAILAACTRMRLPNGKSFSLAGAPAGSEAGASGLPADINNHFWRMFGTALVVGASSYLLPSDDRNITVVSGADGARQVGGNILGTALSQVIQSTIARNVQIPPTGTVDIGTPFTLTLTKDVEMEPYLASQRGGVR